MFRMCFASGICLLLATPCLAHAGTSTLTPSDLVRPRLETIAFFLVCFLVCADVMQRLWNGLREDFVTLPWLSYPKALAVMGLSALLLVLVLTMISGARALMTPGAQGVEHSGGSEQIRREDVD